MQWQIHPFISKATTCSRQRRWHCWYQIETYSDPVSESILSPGEWTKSHGWITTHKLSWWRTNIFTPVEYLRIVWKQYFYNEISFLSIIQFSLSGGSKHNTFVYNLYNYGLTYSTLIQHRINGIQMFCVYWEGGGVGSHGGIVLVSDKDMAVPWL